MNITLNNGEWPDSEGKVWKLVPKEITDQMRSSIDYAIDDNQYTQEVWLSGLDAAPLPTIKTRYDWSRIPEGFDWAATNEDGGVWCCTVEPKISIYGWYYSGSGDERVIEQLGHCHDWRESLEKRPGI